MSLQNTQILVNLQIEHEKVMFFEQDQQGQYRFPGAFLNSGSQPIELAKHLAKTAGVIIDDEDFLRIRFKDVRNFRVDGKNLLVILTTIIPHGDNKFKGHLTEVNKKDLMNIKLHPVTAIMLNLSKKNPDDLKNKTTNRGNVAKNTTDYDELILYSDGGSRGNPGPSACGFVIYDSDDHQIFEGGEYMHITTNNVAEYRGVELALEKALELGAKKVTFRADSMLVINQMNGVWKVKAPELAEINYRIRELVSQFEKVTFTHVYREYNKPADAMVNRILDENQ